MHVRKSTAYTQEEINYLAKFPLITIEKANVNKTYGSVENGVLKAAEAIKKLNPRAKVLYYRNVVINWGGYEQDANFVKNNPESLLKHRKGGLAKMSNGKTTFFDLSQNNVRNYWLDHAKSMTKSPYLDGLFMDANIKVLSTFFKGKVGQEKMEKIQAGYHKMMSDLYESEGDKNILLANLLRVRPEPIFKEDCGLSLMKYFHGSYLEGFDNKGFGYSKEDYLAKGIEFVQKAARNGKIIAMSLGLGHEGKNHTTGIDDIREDLVIDESFSKTLDYKLAIFLICAEKYSYIYPHDGYSANVNNKGQYDSKTWLKIYPQYTKRLGVPKSYAKKNGYVYTRSFEYLDVWVDIQKQEAKLTWK